MEAKLSKEIEELEFMVDGFNSQLNLKRSELRNYRSNVRQAEKLWGSSKCANCSNSVSKYQVISDTDHYFSPFSRRTFHFCTEICKEDFRSKNIDYDMF